MLKLVKAKKDHVCASCRRKIPAGTNYWRDYSENEAVPDYKEHCNCAEYERLPEVKRGQK